MPLPPLDSNGDLPPGVHQATLDEVVARFGAHTPQRRDVTSRLRRIHRLARATGHLRRFLIFGSYVTSKPSPNDIDIILVMEDSFSIGQCDE